MPGLDASQPNVARMYDYLLGGLNNFAADRAAADKILAHLPLQRASAVEHRRFIDRAVRFLAAPRQGVDQFLDVGSGLPTRQSVHEVARSVNARARVAYADYDPVVVSHGKAMLAERDCSIVARADLRDPMTLLSHPEIRGHLDFGRPVALILANVVHWLPDSDHPRAILATLRDALAPGSWLVMTHLSMDLIDRAHLDAVTRAARVFDQASAQPWFRTRMQVEKFFDGWDLAAPGLVPKHEWRPHPGIPAPAFDPAWAGVGRKPLAQG